MGEARASSSVALLRYSITSNEELLLGSFVSLPTICPYKVDLQVVWGFAAAVIRSDFQGSGAPAQPIMLSYVNTGGFFILLLCSERKIIVGHSLQHPIYDLIKALGYVVPALFFTMVELIWYAVSSL